MVSRGVTLATSTYLPPDVIARAQVLGLQAQVVILSTILSFAVLFWALNYIATVFEARHLADEPRTLEDLAMQFKVSRERVRQLEARAFEKVQAATKRSVRERNALLAMHA